VPVTEYDRLYCPWCDSISLNANNSVFENATLVVGANGILECFGSYLECEGNVIPGSAVYVAVGGYSGVDKYGTK